MNSLDRRERILLLLLAGLLLFSGIYYSSSLWSGGQAVLEWAELSGGRPSAGQTDESLENPGPIRNSAFNRFRPALPDFIGGSDLLSALEKDGWSGTYDATLETGGDSLNIIFRGTLLPNGLARGSLSAKNTRDTWVLQPRKRTLYLRTGDSKQYRIGTVRFRDPSPFSLKLTHIENATLGEATSTQWRGNDVYRLNLDSGDGSGRLYVTRTEPHRILEVEWTSDSEWSRRFDYSEDAPNRLLAIRTYRDQNLVSSFRRTSNDTRILEFRSRRASSPSEVIRLQYNPVGNNLKLRLEAHRRMGQKPMLEASGTLRVARDRVDELNVEAEGSGWPDSSSSVRLEVQGTNLTSGDTVVGRTLAAPQSYDEIEAGTFVRNLLSGRAGKQGSDTEASVPSQTDTRSLSTGDDTEVSRTAVQSRTGIRSETGVTESDEPERDDPASQQQTPSVELPEAPEGSGETVVRSEQGAYPSAIPPAGFDKARRLYENGKLDQAAGTLNTLADTFPESINVQFLLGVVEYERGRWAASEEHFQKVLTLPHDPQLRAWSQAYLRIAPDRDGQP